jgi:hypothetical protein
MNERGQSLVEFAIALVFILFLLSGLVEFGIAFFQYVQLSDAAQEGALYGSMCNCTVADITDRALSASDSPISLKENTGVSVVVTAKDKSGTPKDPELVCEGDALSVRLAYAHKIFMPFLPQLLGVDYINLNATVVDTVLQPFCS